MVHTNVSSSVLSIVGSFTNGLDVFKKLRQKRKKSWRKIDEARLDGEELRLSRSLRQGPEDIGREYSRSLQGLGDRYAVGDAVAQTSLAEILLRLNSGLVHIITSFLNRDKRDQLALDYRSLSDLSDHSRVQTVGVLRGLYERMLMRILPRALPATSSRTNLPKPNTNRDFPKKSKKRGVSIARVVVEDSSRPSQLAVVKSGKDTKRKARSSSTNMKAASATTLTLSPQDYKQARPIQHRSHTAPEPLKSRIKHTTTSDRLPTTQPTTTTRTSNPLRATQSTPRLPQVYELEASSSPMPPLPPRYTTQPTPPYDLSGSRRTVYSIASDSTKLGEIPLHKWAVPYDFDAMSVLNREAIEGGWPVSGLRQGQDGGQVLKKKRYRIVRFFRRKEAAS